jgi:hypothetical protein
MRYSHPAREAPLEPGEKIRECSICGDPVTGYGPDLKHEGENVRTTAVPREWLSAIRAATEKGQLALSYVTERATDEERARVVAVALYEAGLLRQRPVKPKSGAKH